MTITVLFILVTVLIAFIVPATIAHGRRVDAVWSEAAAALGLGFRPSGLFQRRRIAGTVAGLVVTLDTHIRRSGKHRRTYTSLDVGFPSSLGLGLRLTRSGFASGIMQLFGARDIQVGEKTFDGAIVVRAVDPGPVRAYLTAARRARIYRLLASFTEAVIDDHGIRWQQRGVMRDVDEVVQVVRRFQSVAWHLIEDRQCDQRLSDALAAADAGRPGEALASLEIEVAADEADVLDDVEEDIVRGHLFRLAGRDTESRAAFAAATEKAPEDEEAQRWSQRMLPTRPVPAPTGPTDADVDAVAVEALCEAVFRPEGTSFEANRRFERQFQGRSVVWEGTLRDVESYGIDFVFESRNGVKGSFEVTQSNAAPFARREVMAVVELSGDAAAALAPRVGETVRFRGTLFRIDAFLRNVYLSSGRIVD